MEPFLDVDLDVVCHLSQKGHYDFIVIGSGIGGGILTQKLVKAERSVLLLEKGSLSFSSHCLNTSRPHWQKGGTKGPSQDNDIMYSMVKAKVETAEGSDPYVGGPVYCLGGRSTVWGLFSPKINDDTLEAYFPSNVRLDLKKWYPEALKLFSWHAETYPNVPGAQHTQDELEEVEFKKSLLENAVLRAQENKGFQAGIGNLSVKIDVATVAAEFIPQWWYNVPQGAYSTVDYLLELLYAKNQFLTVVLNAEVLYVEIDKYQGRIENVVFRDKTQCLRKVKAKTAVVLCAGTIDSARVALNSNLHDKRTPSYIGKGLVDHEIWGVRVKTTKELRQRQPQNIPGPGSGQSPLKPVDTSSSRGDEVAKASKQPLKLHCMVEVHGQPALLNVCINADTFLGRSSPILQGNTHYLPCIDDHTLVHNQTISVPNTLNITLQYCAELNDKNEVCHEPGPRPVLRIRREGIFGGPSESDRANREKWLEDMQALATHIRDGFFAESGPTSETQGVKSGLAMKLADFGVVAHEVGTLRMRCDKDDPKGVVDENLRFIGLDNLYVCDLSIFPVSPPANPTLTLAAFAMRLGERWKNK